MQQSLEEWSVGTRGRGFVEITSEVARRLAASGLKTGLCTLHLRHTSASLLIQENADPDVRADLERFFAKLAPDGDPAHVHSCEGPDDMPAHIRTALTSVNVSIPFRDGGLVLGTWQGIYLWEHRHSPHRRSVVMHLIGE